MEKKLNNSHFYTRKALMLVTLKLTIVAILMASQALGEEYNAITLILDF